MRAPQVLTIDSEVEFHPCNLLDVSELKCAETKALLRLLCKVRHFIDWRAFEGIEVWKGDHDCVVRFVNPTYDSVAHTPREFPRPADRWVCFDTDRIATMAFMNRLDRFAEGNK